MWNSKILVINKVKTKSCNQPKVSWRCFKGSITVWGHVGSESQYFKNIFVQLRGFGICSGRITHFANSFYGDSFLRRKYLSKTQFLSVNEKKYSYSWIFRKFFKLRDNTFKFISIKIGWRDSTFFWWNLWTPFGPLYHNLESDGLSCLGIPLFRRVSETCSTFGWMLPPARSERQFLLHSHLTSLTLLNHSNFPLWCIEDTPHKIFISKLVWKCIKIRKPPCSWALVIWHKAAIPRHAFQHLAFHPQSKPNTWQVIIVGFWHRKTCIFCGSHFELKNHMFLMSIMCTYMKHAYN